MSTIVYRQYSGPPISSLMTSPAINQEGVLGDSTLTTVMLSAHVDLTGGVLPAKVQFTVAGASPATQLVNATDTNQAAGYWYDGAGAFYWRWDATNAFNGPYDISAVAYSSDGFIGNEPHLYPTIAHDVPPAPPGGIVASGGDGTVTLSWNSSLKPKLAGYEVHRASAPTGPWDSSTYLGTVASPGNAYVDPTVVNGTTYYYAVRVVTSDSTPEYSSFAVSAAVTPSQSSDGTPPSAPSGETALAVSGAPTIRLTWVAAVDTLGNPSSGVGHYLIFRSADGVTWSTTPYDTWYTLLNLTYDDSAAGWATTWYYKICAVDVVGTPARTAPWSMTPRRPSPSTI